MTRSLRDSIPAVQPLMTVLIFELLGSLLPCAGRLAEKTGSFFSLANKPSTWWLICGNDQSSLASEKTASRLVELLLRK